MTKAQIETELRLVNAWLRDPLMSSAHWSILFQKMFALAQIWEYGS